MGIASEPLPELRKRELVVFRDTVDGAIELQVVNAHAGLARILQLDFLDDEALEHLVLELGAVHTG